MANKEIDVSIVIVNFKTPELTSRCIDSITKFTKINYEIIVVDNGSNDESPKLFKQLEKKKLIKFIASNKNLGFAAGNNLGIDQAKGKSILLLNSDTEVKDNVIANVYKWMISKKEVGIASCALVGTDGKLQSAGGSFPSILKAISWMTIEDLPFVKTLIPPFHYPAENYHKPLKLDWVSGTFYMVKKEVIDTVGKLDSDYFMYTEEVDFCYRAAINGWESWHLPQWSILHYGKASSSNEFALKREFIGVKLFYNKHYPSWHTPILRLFLKLGSVLRVIAFSFIGKGEIAKIYAKAYQVA